MSGVTNGRQTERPPRIFGSALAAFAGWFALNAFLTIRAFITRAEHHSSPPIPNEWMTAPLVFAIYSAIYVGLTWIIVFLPLYCLIPPGSVWWRWPICTICGALAGGLIIFAFNGPDLPMIVLAAMTGGVTCLFAALTRSRFR